jgi:hypothetical protein
MRTEQEIREKMNACNAVSGFGMSNGPCPFNKDGDIGCCAECNRFGMMEWMLGDDKNPTHNEQERMIEMVGQTIDIDKPQNKHS